MQTDNIIYAVKHKREDKWLKAHRVNNVVGKLSQASFYHNKIGPSQLLYYVDKNDWEIKLYKVVEI